MNETEDHFLEHIRTELSLPSSDETKPLVKSVMHALRKTLSRQSAEIVVKRLPEFLRSYFTENEPEEKQVNVEHLDELVSLIMEEDSKKEKTLFKSEIQTLSVILLTLQRIWKRSDNKEGTGLNTPLYYEVMQASM